LLYKLGDVAACFYINITLVDSPTNALFINLFKCFKFTLKYTIIRSYMFGL